MRLQSQRRVIMAIIIVGFICVAMVVLTAYATELRVYNNELISEINVLQGEVETLNVRIKEANNIQRIEEVATHQLGMVYPEGEECVYLSQQNEPAGSLAMLIRENAYS